MSTFKSAIPRKPRNTLLIPVVAFTEDWRERPTAPVAVGLRLLSEKDCELAMSSAATAAVEAFASATTVFPNELDDVYRSRMMGVAIARAICDPNDVLAAHPAFVALEDQVMAYFTPAGVEFVYQALDELTVKSSPIIAPTSDADLLLLRVHLRVGTIAKLPRADMLSARRLLGRALEMLTAAAPEVTADDGDDSSQDEPDAEDAAPTYAISVTT